MAGFIGRLVPEKGVDDILRVAAETAVATRFAFRGHGSASSNGDSFARAHVRHLGAVDHKDVATAIHACDFLLMPSKRTTVWEEQFGRVAVESKLRGRPVVAYESGALPDVVGAGGILVAEGEVHALVAAVAELTTSREHIRELGMHAFRAAVQRYTPETVAPCLVSFWHRVLDR